MDASPGCVVVYSLVVAGGGTALVEPPTLCARERIQTVGNYAENRW